MLIVSAETRMGSDRLVIVDGVRTPFCKAGTDLAGLDAVELGRIAVTALLARTGIDPEIVDEVVFGCVGQPVDAMNVARVLALRAGLPRSAPAVTVHRNCASSMEAVTQAYEKMAAGAGSVFIVGGTESMSDLPLLFPRRAVGKFTRLARARTLGRRLAALASFRPADFKPRIGLELGLTDPVPGLNMGETAEVLAREWAISRERQDAFSLRSHQRVVAGRERLAEEIAPVYRDGRAVALDNGVRPNQTMEQLGKLRPVFQRRHGTVTAGNSSQITDGAVALLVMAESRAGELALEPLGALAGYAYAGCDPERMGMGPVHAIHRAQKKLGLGPADADVVEINEAFAVQVLAVLEALRSPEFAREKLGRDEPLGEIPDDKLNVNGGAIALGHPVGSSGGRLVLTALRELRRRGGKRALASLCVGGGQGAALWLER
ncbi:MAG: thiolase family protein [Planctomycetota bacterium]